MSGIRLSRVHIALEVPQLWHRSARYGLDVDSKTGAVSGRSLTDEVVSFRIPGDFLGRVLAVDESDPEAFLDFINSYGSLGVGRGELGAHAVRWREASERRMAELVPFDEFQVGVRWLRRAQEIAAELHAGPNLARLRDIEVPATPERLDLSQLARMPHESVSDFVEELEDFLHLGLRNFQLTFLAKHRNRHEPRLSLAVGSSLYSVACLQLAWALVAGLPWQHCASETCSVLFAPSRPDQLYHDSRCARTQANREYRRREKRKLEGTSKGAD